MSDTMQESTSKESVINSIKILIDSKGFSIAETDFTRPWGAFFRLENSDAEKFIDTYFSDIKDQLKRLKV